jgi:hypothetical protein
MARIQPYHGILFLEDSVPSPDSNPFVLRFLEEYEPSRSIEELALLSGLSAQSQVLQIVRHYLLWARVSYLLAFWRHHQATFGTLPRTSIFSWKNLA